MEQADHQNDQGGRQENAVRYRQPGDHEGSEDGCQQRGETQRYRG
jgi:hypothetical protein